MTAETFAQKIGDAGTDARHDHAGEKLVEMALAISHFSGILSASRHGTPRIPFEVVDQRK